MQDAIIYIDPDNPVNLQNQIRQKIVAAILATACATWILHYSSVNTDSWVSSVFWLAQATIGLIINVATVALILALLVVIMPARILDLGR